MLDNFYSEKALRRIVIACSHTSRTLDNAADASLSRSTPASFEPASGVMVITDWRDKCYCPAYSYKIVCIVLSKSKWFAGSRTR